MTVFVPQCYSNLLVTLRFGPNDKTDPYLLEMSKHLDFMQFFNMTTIIGLIELGLPSMKITVQQQICHNVYEHRIFNDTKCFWHLASYYALCEEYPGKHPVEILCGMKWHRRPNCANKMTKIMLKSNYYAMLAPKIQISSI